MSDVSDTIKTATKEKEGFISYITTFNDEHKSEIMNIIQYSILAIIPVMIILKSVKSLVPEDDESKGCLEISMECILQIIFIMVSIWLTNRLIRYVPTYSKVEYGKFTPENFIIPLLIILATMQSKLGFKLNILMDRAMDLWHGRKDESVPKNNTANGNSTNGSNMVGMNMKTSPQNVNYIIPPTEGYANPTNVNNPDNQNLLGSNQTGVFPHKSCDIGGDVGNTGVSGGLVTNAPTELALQDEPMPANMGFGGAFGSTF